MKFMLRDLKPVRTLCRPTCDGMKCCGCSGFARTHPELFGCCSTSCPCPDCYGIEFALLFKEITRGFEDAFLVEEV